MTLYARQLLLVAIVLLAGLPLSSVHASVSTGSHCDPDGLQDSGAVYRLCMPDPGKWNGDLVIYAHGYVAFNEPIQIPEDQLGLPDGLSIPELVNRLGYAFATTSYSTNGLAVLEGIADILDLIEIFTQEKGAPNRIYLTGPSQGGIITALATEQHPAVFDGGLAVCGPIGDFRAQMNYFGDFRVVFDYFFPDVLPGIATEIPDEVINNWSSVYAPKILDAIRANPSATRQLLRVTRAPIDRHDLSTMEATVLSVLWYNVFATNDGIAKLGGNPFDNTQRWYSGSWNDLHLNRRVARFQADQAALDAIEANYQTTGQLSVPVVVMHTTGDQIIPYWHAPVYRAKVAANRASALHNNLPILRYGHCDFRAVEVLVGFALLVRNVTGEELVGADRALPDPEMRAEFLELARTHRALR